MQGTPPEVQLLQWTPPQEGPVVDLPHLHMVVDIIPSEPISVPQRALPELVHLGVETVSEFTIEVISHRFLEVHQSLLDLGRLATGLDEYCRSMESTQVQRMDQLSHSMELLATSSQNNFDELGKAIGTLQGHFQHFANVWTPDHLRSVMQAMNALRSECHQKSVWVKEHVGRMSQEMSQLQQGHLKS